MVDPRNGGELPGLDEYNTQAEESWLEAVKEGDGQRPAGVACMECGREMEYEDNVLREVFPPRKKVTCPRCGETGLKVVG